MPDLQARHSPEGNEVEEGVEEEGSGSEYVVSEKDYESEEEMEPRDVDPSPQPRGKKPAKRGRQDVINARAAVGKRKSGTDLREVYVLLPYLAHRLYACMPDVLRDVSFAAYLQRRFGGTVAIELVQIPLTRV